MLVKHVVATTFTTMRPMRHDLAKQAKAARERAGLTQAKAAVKLSTSAASLAAYEQATRDIPDAMVDAMADAYGVHPAVFRYGSDVLRLAANHEAARVVREAATQLGALADVLESASHDVDAATVTQFGVKHAPTLPTDTQSSRPKIVQADHRIASPLDDSGSGES